MRFDARFEALVVAAERIVEMVVAGEHADFRVAIELGNEETDFTLETLEAALVLAVIAPPHQLAAVHVFHIAPMKTLDRVVLLFRQIVVETPVDPAAQEFHAEAGLVEISPAKRTDRIVVSIRADDEVAAGNLV